MKDTTEENPTIKGKEENINKWYEVYGKNSTGDVTSGKNVTWAQIVAQGSNEEKDEKDLIRLKQSKL